MECVNCYSDSIIKYGHWRKGSQRMFCNKCHSTFTPIGIRWTYPRWFMENIVHQYKHQHKTAKEVVSENKISSRTLIKRSKLLHQSDCSFCK